MQVAYRIQALYRLSKQSKQQPESPGEDVLSSAAPGGHPHRTFESWVQLRRSEAWYLGMQA